ncbi:hypothetical protein [Paraflavitalea speifideaquila]|uniref:hypothetical protein n=1 Tax=Paraflavitalea speifideaquila TaxID=3076558 RepID=UPI0028E927C3|nr:hypothetical protein [Paraflavitalea speifideiaquila]
MSRVVPSFAPMKIKLLFTLFCCALTLARTLSYAQGGGTLHGKVFSSDGQPAEGVSVVLVGKNTLPLPIRWANTKLLV